MQAAAYRPGQPGSSLAVQAAACRALQAAGPWQPGEGGARPAGHGRAAAGHRTGWELFRTAPPAPAYWYPR